MCVYAKERERERKIKKVLVVDFVISVHVKCHSIKSSNLNLIGLFSTERGKRDVENSLID